jgi:hypothetical protein
MVLHVVDGSAVMGVGLLGAHRFAVDAEVVGEVPQLHRPVAAAGQELALDMRVPLEGKAFLLVP